MLGAGVALLATAGPYSSARRSLYSICCTIADPDDRGDESGIPPLWINSVFGPYLVWSHDASVLAKAHL